MHDGHPEEADAEGDESDPGHGMSEVVPVSVMVVGCEVVVVALD